MNLVHTDSFLILAGLSESPGGTLKIQASELMVARGEGRGAEEGVWVWGEVGNSKGIS